MKIPRQMRSSGLRSGAVICLTAASVCAQSQRPPLLLELKTCNRELQVFEDGTMTESRDGKQTKRRLSERRMRKLSRIIAGAPCPMQFESKLPSPADSTREQPAVMMNFLGDDCSVPAIVSGTIPEALRTVEVTRRKGTYTGASTVYIPCEGASTGQKEWLKRNSHEYLKPKWHRFLSELAGALGGKSILKGCKCSEDMFTGKRGLTP